MKSGDSPQNIQLKESVKEDFAIKNLLLIHFASDAARKRFAQGQIVTLCAS